VLEVGDLVYLKGIKEMGIIVDIIQRANVYKYKVHFFESNFAWTYSEEELTRIEET
jgi:hypothetical protein